MTALAEFLICFVIGSALVFGITCLILTVLGIPLDATIQVVVW